MSGSSTAQGPPPMYIEDVNEDSQTTIPGSKQSANTAVKRSKEVKRSGRDAASDSGYSSHTAATGGSSSQESNTASVPKSGLKSLGRKMAGAVRKSSTKEQGSPPKAQVKRPITRTQKKDNLRVNLPESREDAAKIRLSGTAVEPAKANTVHGRPSNIQENQPPVKPRPALQVASQAIPIHPAAVRVRTLSTDMHPTSRPASYHGAVPNFPPYMYAAPQIYQRPPPPQMSLPTTFYAPVYRGPATTYVPTPLQTSPNRQISYPFSPTTPPHYAPGPRWQPEGYYPLPSSFPHAPQPVARRYSVQGAPPIVEYPSVPPIFHPPIHPHADYDSRRLSVASVDQFSIEPPLIEDEAVFLEENEAYYRRLMPPPPVPQRPAMRHSATTSTAVHRRSDRNLELVSSSPRKPSFEEARPASRPSLPSRTSSTKNTVRAAEAPVSPAAIRRGPSRPVSYNGGVDQVRQAEEYQALQRGQNRQVPLTENAIQQVNRADQLVKVKSKSKGGSETGSRASSSREGSEAKKRKSLDKYRASMAAAAEEDVIKLRFKQAQGMRIDLRGGDGVEGRTIRLRQSQDGDGVMEMSIGGSERSKYRDSRPKERERRASQDRRYSVSARREVRKIREFGEPAGGHRRSSSRPVTSRESHDGSYKELEEKLKNLRAEAGIRKHEASVVEDEEGEDAKEIDKALMERLQRLRTSSRSRRSSRSTVSRRSMAAAPTHILAGTEAEPY
ncbi:MAG: hypothetical protein LQ340_006798 [Diploschistes diacapsis]|nr:MAG: hypothetical protein LQ340_006798 [Diploschistes diacapsis]